MFAVKSLFQEADGADSAERKLIFLIQLTKRKRNPADYDLDRVAAAAKGFSGAEVESAVQTALYAAYSRPHARRSAISSARVVESGTVDESALNKSSLESSCKRISV